MDSRDTAYAERPTSDGAGVKFVVPGDTVGRYRVLDLIGEGGMGVVFAAHDPRLCREVALKVIRADAARSSYRQRVMREAQALARLSHPNVVPVFDVGVEAGIVWVAMQRLAGPTLAAWILDKRSWAAIIDAFVQAGRGLEAAHRAGLVHRDFKPGNAMFDADGRVVVLDFGLAWAPGPSTAGASARGEDVTDRVRGNVPVSGRDPLGITITAAGSVVGTVPYMAPEQHEWREIDARSDQYAFCVSLYEALFGVRPFHGDVHEAATAKRKGPPAPSPTALSKIPARLWRAIERGLNPDPDKRWPDLGTLIGELVSIRRGRKRWPWAIAAAGVTATLGIAASSLANEPKPCTVTASLDATWNPTRRDRLESAFSTLGAAKDASWPRVRDHVDALVSDWRTRARDACTLAAVQDVPPEALTCLQRASEALDETLGVLESPDPTRAARAVRLIEGLAERHGCTSDDTPHSGLDEAMRRRFERGRALMAAGALPEARDHAIAMLADAQAAGDTTAVAWALLLRGGAEMDGAGTRESALAHLQDAMWTATSAGDDVAMTTASIKLVHWCASAYDTACAEPWLRSAESGLTRLGSAGAAIERELDLARGDVAVRSGAADEALGHYRRALAAVREAHGDHGLFETVVVEAIGIAHAHAGRHEEALRSFAEAGELQAKRLGRADTARCSTLELAAGSLYALGRFAEARAALEQGLVNIDAAFGEDHPHAIRARGNLVLLLLEGGEPAAALELAQEIVERKRRVFGPNDVQVAIGLYNEGTVHTAMGNHTLAAARYDESLALWEAASGSGHLDLAHPLAGQANAAAETGDGTRARDAAQRAVTLHERHGAPVPPTLWFDLGRAHALLGDVTQGRALVERAAAAMSEERRPGTINRDDALAWLADHPAS